MEEDDLDDICARALIEESSLLVVALDDELEVRWANPAATARLGEVAGTGESRPSLLQLVHPEDLAIVGAGLATRGNVSADGERSASRNASVVVRVADGTEGWSAMEVSGVWTYGGPEPLLVVVARDVSARHAATTALGMSVDGAPLDAVLAQLAVSFHHQLGPVELTVLTEEHPAPLFRTPTAGRTGWTVIDLPSVHDLLRQLGDPDGDGVVALPVTDHHDWCLALPLPGGERPAGLIVLEGSGITPTPLWVRESTRALRDLVAVAVVQSANRAELERRVVTDPLTELLNRSGLALALERTVERDRAVLYVDLDGFKEINDVHGHAVGDEVLVAVADRLTECVREHDEVARFGGDEFVVLALDVGRSTTEELGARIVERLGAPFEVAGVGLHIGASVGCSVATAGSDPDALLLVADRMLYKAKRDGGRRLALATLDS